MSENNAQNADPQPSQGPGKETPDLVAELREMGQQLEAAFRAAIESDRAKQLQRDIAGGIRELTTQLKSAAQKVEGSPRVQRVEERGRQVVDQARQSDVLQKAQEAVATGLSQINDQLRKLVERIEQDQPAEAQQQQVPVEHETPATGETTRLDDKE